MRLLLALPLLIAAPALAQDAPVQGPGEGHVSIESFGVICDAEHEGERPAPGTVSGILNLVSEHLTFDLATTHVPADIGISFGIRSELADGQEPITADVVVTHPPMGPQGQTLEVWSVDLYPGDPSISMFSFEKPFEQVQGPWRFELRSGSEVLVSQDFLVTAPGSQPAVQSLCFSAQIMS